MTKDKEILDKILTWNKYHLTVAEASEYFNISEKRFREFLAQNSNENFILYNGRKVLIKRKELEKFFDNLTVL